MEHGSIFSESRFSLALVYISSGGIIRQDEYRAAG